ncbi:transposase [Saccharolobus islandicus]|uniref:transposase n=1 Tax=Saccharolobus islandicus TaxID=43080 RepID=UPI0030837003
MSDDFSGLDRVVSTLFPSSQHQLCITHMIRNLMRVLQECGGGKEGYIVPQPTRPTLFSGPSQEAS